MAASSKKTYSMTRRRVIFVAAGDFFGFASKRSLRASRRPTGDAHIAAEDLEQSSPRKFLSPQSRRAATRKNSKPKPSSATLPNGGELSARSAFARASATKNIARVFSLVALTWTWMKRPSAYSSKSKARRPTSTGSRIAWVSRHAITCGPPIGTFTPRIVAVAAAKSEICCSKRKNLVIRALFA